MEKTIETYSQVQSFERLLHRIDSLALLEAENGSFPYTGDFFPSQNVNLVTGKRYRDMNRINIDLTAARQVIKRLTFITASPAQTAGLTLSGYDSENEEPFTRDPGTIDDGSIDGGTRGDDNPPFLVMFNVRCGDGTLRPEYEYAWFLDQYDGDSIIRAYNSPRFSDEIADTHTRAQIHTVVRNIIGFSGDYDSGLLDEEVSQDVLDSLKHNLKNDTEEFAKAAALHDFYTAGRDAGENIIFENIRRWYTNQTAGRQIFKYTADTKTFLQAVKETAGRNNGRFAFTSFEAGVFSDRLMRRNFGIEDFYKPSLEAPAAFKIRKSSKENIKCKSFNIEK
jgi:hypothetical protein